MITESNADKQDSRRIYMYKKDKKRKTETASEKTSIEIQEVLKVEILRVSILRLLALILGTFEIAHSVRSI